MRRFAARVCLAAGLGVFVLALPAFAEVSVFTHATPSHTAVAAVTLRETKPEPAPAAEPDAPDAPVQDEPSSSPELLMLVAGLTVIGLVTLWRG